MPVVYHQITRLIGFILDNGETIMDGKMNRESDFHRSNVKNSRFATLHAFIDERTGAEVRRG